MSQLKRLPVERESFMGKRIAGARLLKRGRVCLAGFLVRFARVFDENISSDKISGGEYRHKKLNDVRVRPLAGIALVIVFVVIFAIGYRLTYGGTILGFVGLGCFLVGLIPLYYGVRCFGC